MQGEHHFDVVSQGLAPRGRLIQLCWLEAGASIGPASSGATIDSRRSRKASPRIERCRCHRLRHLHFRTPGIVISHAAEQPLPVAGRGIGQELHDAAQRRIAPGGCSAALDDFPRCERFAGNLAPGDPAAKRIVQGDAVEEHEGTTGSAGPIPRRETPWVVGFAVRLPSRRNRLNPGTESRASSTVSAGLVLQGVRVEGRHGGGDLGCRLRRPIGRDNEGLQGYSLGPRPSKREDSCRRAGEPSKKEGVSLEKFAARLVQIRSLA